MKILWEKYKEILVAFFFIAILVGMFLIAKKYLFEGINSNKDEVQEAILSQESKEKRLAGIPAYKEQILLISEEGKKMQVLLVKEKALNLIEKIESAAQEVDTDVSISIDENGSSESQTKKTVNSKKNDEKTIMDELPTDKYLQLKLVFQGDYKRIRNFLKKLETIGYMNDVVSLQIEKFDDNERAVSQGGFGSIPEKKEKADVTGGADRLKASANVVFYLQQ